MRGVVRDLRVGDLFYAVCIEKIAGNIDDRTPLEEHLHAPVIRNDGNGRRRKVFTRGEADKFVPVLFRNDDRHALLRLGDGEFRTRQPLVFERHFSRSMTSPSASSPMATETPPAPKSLHF